MLLRSVGEDVWTITFGNVSGGSRLPYTTPRGRHRFHTISQKVNLRFHSPLGQPKERFRVDLVDPRTHEKLHSASTGVGAVDNHSVGLAHSVILWAFDGRQVRFWPVVEISPHLDTYSERWRLRAVTVVIRRRRLKRQMSRGRPRVVFVLLLAYLTFLRSRDWSIVFMFVDISRALGFPTLPFSPTPRFTSLLLLLRLAKTSPFL